ncbi:MAG: indolepyruvate oxidoreductase subunit beta [Lachnospiraceae bacterium]|nr:indolepyruvate oxidoreductase subunit beta [Lachnospiraceae bacterium]
MSKSVILCGVGGQGTVLASKLISYAAMAKGEDVKSAETIGMAQRGGSVTSHVRMGENAFSPLIPQGKADVMIAFEPAEAVRNLSYIKEDGVVIVSKKAVKPVTASLSKKVYEGKDMLDYLEKKVKRLLVVDGEKAMAELGSSKVLNVVLLGAAIASDEIDLSMDEIRAAIDAKIPEKFHELNNRALEAGARLYLGITD